MWIVPIPPKAPKTNIGESIGRETAVLVSSLHRDACRPCQRRSCPDLRRRYKWGRADWLPRGGDHSTEGSADACLAP